MRKKGEKCHCCVYPIVCCSKLEFMIDFASGREVWDGDPVQIQIRSMACRRAGGTKKGGKTGLRPGFLKKDGNFSTVIR